VAIKLLPFEAAKKTQQAISALNCEEMAMTKIWRLGSQLKHFPKMLGNDSWPD
jgi:hypothetical protein